MQQNAHAIVAHVALSGPDNVIVLEDSPDQIEKTGSRWENTDHASSSFYFSIQTFDQVGRVEFSAMCIGKMEEREEILASIF